MHDIYWHGHTNGRGAVRVIWDILGDLGENCGPLTGIPSGTFIFIHSNNALSPSDHQPSQTPNKALKQNAWAAGFPISAAATEKWDEETRAKIYSP